jgi:hypothetical protein
VSDLDLAAAALGLPVALLAPVSIPALRSRYWARLVTTALVATYAVATAFPGWRAWLVVASVVAVAALYRPTQPVVQPADHDLVAAGPPLDEVVSEPVHAAVAAHAAALDPPGGEPPAAARSGRPAVLAAVAVAVLAGGILILDPRHAVHALKHAVTDREVAVVLLGGALAVFVAGAAVAWILVPFTAVLRRQNGVHAGLVNAGRYIGWLERLVLFAFLLSGSPEAAAFALAAKSVARYPTLSAHQEGFAEYYLIGTLASLALASVAAVLTRLALGLSPL